MTIFLLLVLLIAPFARAAGPNQLTPEERAQGWRLLFDGKSTAGWEEVTGKPFPNSWTVEDGCLKTVLRPDGAQDIRPADEYGQFELQWEWRVREGGNSGVKYLVQRVDEWTNPKGRQARARGLEYQLADDREPGAAVDPKQAAGALYSVIAPSPRVTPRVGEFNQSRLIVRNGHVEHWLNGVRVVAFDTAAPAVQKALRNLLPKGSGPDAPLHLASPVCLQNHSSEAWFRTIKIRPLE